MKIETIIIDSCHLLGVGVRGWRCFEVAAGKQQLINKYQNDNHFRD